MDHSVTVAIADDLELGLTTAPQNHSRNPKALDAVALLEAIWLPVVVVPLDEKFLAEVFECIVLFPGCDAIIIQINLPLAVCFCTRVDACRVPLRHIVPVHRNLCRRCSHEPPLEGPVHVARLPNSAPGGVDVHAPSLAVGIRAPEAEGRDAAEGAVVGHRHRLGEHLHGEALDVEVRVPGPEVQPRGGLGVRDLADALEEAR
mmetsp:Transcript_105202/g.285667  ORF Transcript_105202/g.285667 Transcript_105202/m.285667 type:complete len:203 (-) Transcript_105202:873-1481(-)